jgi:glutamine amidotransferase
MIVIIDYEMGNVGSIDNMLKKIGAEALISGRHEDISRADKLILPGVGAFDEGMKKLKAMDLISLLNEKVLIRKTPTLGICLGMQLFTRRSEEGMLPGLGWFDADTVRFRFENNSQGLRIPHMGWDEIIPQRASHLLTDLDHQARFYFVHSYHARCDRKEDVLATTHYGYDFASMIQKDNIVGTQFHPEKSHKFGLRLLQNFSRALPV